MKRVFPFNSSIQRRIIPPRPPIFFSVRTFAGNKVNFSKDYYTILGCSIKANPKEIRQAYLQQAKKWHPDIHTDSSEAEKEKASQQFLEIQEAYEILSNQGKKLEYDNVKLKTSGGTGYHKQYTTFHQQHKKSQYQTNYQAKYDTGSSGEKRNTKESAQGNTFRKSDFEQYDKERKKRQYQTTGEDFQQEMWEFKKKKMDEERKMDGGSIRREMRDNYRFKKTQGYVRFGLWASVLLLFVALVQEAKHQYEAKMYGYRASRERTRAARIREEYDEQYDAEGRAHDFEGSERKYAEMRQRVKNYQIQKYGEFVPADGKEAFRQDQEHEMIKRKRETIEAMIEESKKRARIMQEQTVSANRKYYEKRDRPRNAPSDPAAAAGYSHGQLPTYRAPEKTIHDAGGNELSSPTGDLEGAREQIVRMNRVRDPAAYRSYAQKVSSQYQNANSTALRMQDIDYEEPARDDFVMPRSADDFAKFHGKVKSN